MSTAGTVEQIALATRHPEHSAPAPSVRAEAGHDREGERADIVAGGEIAVGDPGRAT